MKTHSPTCTEDASQAILGSGPLDARDMAMVEEIAAARGVSLQRVLIEDCGLPESVMRRMLEDRCQADAAKFDERLSIPRDLLDAFHEIEGRKRLWFPFGRRKDGLVLVAAPNPTDEATRGEAVRAFGEHCLLVPALEQDVNRLIQDFLTRDSGSTVGAERTALAFWRNTMALWRTRLACYRTDLAQGRTGLNILRWGLGMVALTNGLMRKLGPGEPTALLWCGLAFGLIVAAWGFSDYLAIRRHHLRPPEVQTMVEVTAVILSFLEEFHFVQRPAPDARQKKTMLGRLGDFLCDHSTVLSVSPAYRVRIHLARERNVLAAQRTIGACYRTIAARARTGLSFLRTGVALTGLGFGLMQYFGLSYLTVFDAMLILGGLGMIADGVFWSLPVRGEYSETPRCNADV